jgi:hypothetical protein
MFFLFNHRPTPEQMTDAESSFKIQQVVNLPADLKIRWSQIPADAPAIAPFLAPFKDWLCDSAHAGDLVVIQGDPGATYLMVHFAMELGLIPVYATTERKALEEALPDGSIRLVHHFIHRRFRKYGE